MPSYIRWRERGATYFFTLVTDRRRPLFADPRARRSFRRALVDVRLRWPFEMFAAVLLPDHFHCIWTIETDDNFPLRWANVKRLTTKRYLALGGREAPVTDSRRRRRERGIWQPRYWEHLIRDEKEMLAFRDYIHLNLVEHGYVTDPVA